MKGIIFDLDGVICSTDRFHFDAWRTVMESVGITIGEDVNSRIRGVSRMEGLNRILGDRVSEFSQEQKEELAREKNELYITLLDGMSEKDVSSEVLDTLYKLRKMGLKMAIGSSSKNAKLVLQKIRLGDFFDAVSDGNGIQKAKPDPEVFLRAAAMIGLTPSQCLVVEDAFTGIDAAQRGGFMSAGIGDAARYAKADYRLEHFGDLIRIAESQKKELKETI